MNSNSIQTLPQLFEESVRKFSDRIMVWEKKTGTYEGTTYAAVRESVYQCAAGLMGLGIQKGDRIAPLSEGRNDWVIAELGILYSGAVNVPLSVKIDEPSELRFRLDHAGCRMAIVSGNQAHKISGIRSQLPALKQVILLEGPDEQTDSGT